MAWSVGVLTKRGSRWSILDKEEDWIHLLRTHNLLNSHGDLYYEVDTLFRV